MRIFARSQFSHFASSPGRWPVIGSGLTFAGFRALSSFFFAWIFWLVDTARTGADMWKEEVDEVGMGWITLRRTGRK